MVIISIERVTYEWNLNNWYILQPSVESNYLANKILVNQFIVCISINNNGLLLPLYHIPIPNQNKQAGPVITLTLDYKIKDHNKVLMNKPLHS